MVIKAALGVDCEVYEMARFQDNYGAIYGIDDIETVQNLILNPSFDRDLSNWSISTAGTGSSLTRNTVTTAAIQGGAASMKWATGTSVTNPKILAAQVPVYANKTYVVSFYYYQPSTNTLPSLTPTLTFYSSSGSTLSSSSPSAITAVTNTITRVSYSFTTPANTVTLALSVTLNGSVTTTSFDFYIDSVMLQAGNSPQPYFDGDTTGYRWTGAAGGSASILASPIDALSRSKVPSRNEFVLYPHKNPITTLERIEARKMAKRLAPVSTIVTIATTGYAVNNPVNVLMVKSDSTYFTINSYVTGAPGSKLSPNEEPNSTFRWVEPGVEKQAPALAFNQPQEYSEYYLYSTGLQSSIDSVTYTSEDIHGRVKVESNYKSIVEAPNRWGAWTPFEKADSPDNYPGGKQGHSPTSHTDVTYPRTGKRYVFPFPSQAVYVAQMKAKILSVGGQVRGSSDYRLPIAGAETVQNTWTPDEAVANAAPIKSSVISTGWYLRPSIGS
jgi:hypothetical protein